MRLFFPRQPAPGMRRFVWWAIAVLLCFVLVRLMTGILLTIGGQRDIRPGRILVSLLAAAVLYGGLFFISRRSKNVRSTTNSRGQKDEQPSALHANQTGLSRVSRYAPVLGLLLLAPWVGEYLLGNVPASSIALLPLLIPLYGGGALLIREVARRTGRGWPTILLLAAAYGIIEAGLVDQTLFSSHLLDDAVTKTATFIPLIGIDAYNSLSFIAGHVIWSIGIPIAIVELLTPSRRAIPWLGVKGLVMTAALYLLGCLIIFLDALGSPQFLASPAQWAGAAAVAATLVLLAFKTRSKLEVAPQTYAPPRPWQLGLMAFVVSGVFFARPENWLGGVLGGLIILMIAAVFIVRWSQHISWTLRHHFALVAGTLPTYAWGGFVLIHLTVPNDRIAFIGNIVFALITAGLLFIAGRSVAKTTSSSNP